MSNYMYSAWYVVNTVKKASTSPLAAIIIVPIIILKPFPSSMELLPVLGSGCH